MNQTNTSSTANRITCLFAYPFRIFFLSLACWAVLVIPLWIAFISGLISLPLVSGPMPWHQHEMLFGYVTPAIAGFLLTAVCVWTQTERLHGRTLALLWTIWLAGRLSFFGGEWLPYAVVVAINLAFLPLIMLDAGRRIWQAKQSRQIPILLVLGALWVVEAAMLLSYDPVNAEGALILIMALMLIVGGRITPTFSDGWLKQRGGTAVSRTLPWLEKVLLPLLLLLLISTYLAAGSTVSATAALFSSHNASSHSLFAAITALGQPALALLLAVVTLVRLLLWRGWHVSQEPLLWSLHVALLWIPVALLLLAGGKLDGWSPQAWLHAAGIGAVGGLILAVISRVSLGHTGRPLVLPRGMVAALLSIHLAATFRVATALDIMPYLPGLTITAALWTLAFLQFLLRYTPILTTPRPDGRPG